MGAYTRVNVEGFTLNQWTADIYHQVQNVYLVLGGTGHVYLAQGSYNTTVSASAGTHNGGGALDVMPSVETEENYKILQTAVRYCMIAGWHRLPSQGPWGEHVHGILIGDIDAAPVAKQQVVSYRSKPPRDGLVDNAVDNTWHPPVIFVPNYPLHSVNLHNMVVEARKTTSWVPRVGVARIQRALNKKMAAGLVVNGLFNRKTRAAYAKWELSINGNGDGIPGKRSLTLLGAGRFNVV